MNLNLKNLDDLKEYSLINEEIDWIQILKSVLFCYHQDYYKKNICFFLSDNVFYGLAPFGAYVHEECCELVKDTGIIIDDEFEMSFFKSAAKIIHYPIKKMQNYKNNYIGYIKSVVFSDIAERLKKDVGYYEFVCDFPMSIRILCIYSKRYIDSFQKMLGRLSSDREMLGIDFTEQIIIKSMSSDIHGECTGVYKIDFKDKSIVYKSRSIKLFKLFDDVTKLILDDKSFLPDYIDMGSYGYTEFIEKNTCISDYNVYLNNWGVLLAFLYLFSSTDMHMDNILSKNNTPVIIDIETLVNVFQGDDNELMRFLKMGIFYNKSADKFSSLGSLGNALKKGNEIKGLSISEMSKIVIDGFVQAYDKILENRDKIISLLNLDMYSDVQIRCIFRDTSIYDRLIASFYSNDNLCSLDNYRRKLEKVNNAFKVEHRGISRQEYKCLINGDIPIFVSRFNDKKIYYKNTMVDSDYLKKSPIEIVVENVLSMNNISKKYSERIIKECIVNLFFTREHLYKKNSNLTYISINYEEYHLNDAKKKLKVIASFLKSSAIHLSDGNVVWIMPYKNLSITDRNLFFGNIGIAFFLSLYGSICNDKEALKISNDVLEYSLKILKDIDLENFSNISFTTGFSGVLFGLWKIAEINNNYECQKRLNKIANEFAFFMLSDNYDFYDGNSGALYVLSKFRLSECALKEFERKAEILYKYDFKNMNQGFSHGTSGIAFALCNISKKLDKSQYMKRAAEIINCVNIPQDEEIYGICGGFAGILFSITNIDKNIYSKKIKYLWESGKKRYSEMMIKNNISLCCGQSGVILLLSKLYSESNNPAFLETALRSFSIYKNKFDKDISLSNGMSGIGLALLSILYPQKFFQSEWKENDICK